VSVAAAAAAVNANHAGMVVTICGRDTAAVAPRADVLTWRGLSRSHVSSVQEPGPS